MPAQSTARARPWSVPAAGRRRWPRGADVVLAAALAVAAAVASYWGSCGIDALLVRGEQGDVWFEADCPRVFENLTDRASIQSRAAVHPLATLWAYPPVWVLRRVAGLEPIVALRILRALTAAACMIAFYGLLRMLAVRRLDSVLCALLAAVSAASMFWFVVPETYPSGLLTILLALCLVTASAERRLTYAWDVAINVATFSFTITNWMAGLFGTFVCRPVRRAVPIVLIAVCLMLGLMAIQHEFFPSAARWPISLEESEYTLHHDAGGPVRAGVSFIFHSVVMPTIGTVQRYDDSRGPVMSVQHAGPALGSPWAVAATVLWTVLLALGVWGMCTCRRHRRVRLVLALTIAGQLALHAVYGLETFLYSCHFGPLLIVVAAFATLTPLRRVAVVLTAALIVCAAINNAVQFGQARSFVQDRARPASQVAVGDASARASAPAACADTIWI